MELNKKELTASIFSLGVVFLFLSYAYSEQIIKPRLYDGSINELGRYSFTFDAYEHIEENSDNPIIALGSSKMREIFDGQLIEEFTAYDGEFFNLAYAGERPYVRMIEIDAIVELNPKLVIIEVGPNSFSALSDPAPESILSRMEQLMALNSHWNSQTWKSALSEQDRDILSLDRIGQMEYFASISPEAVESTLAYKLNFEKPPYSCDFDWGTVHCVPDPDSPEYDSYLKYPIQFRNSLKIIKEGNAKWTIEEFYGERLDQYLSQSYHNPEGVANKNHLAYDFILQSLIENDIPVVLVGLPYNPVLIDRLSEGQWDYYNSSVLTYQANDEITVIDYMWGSHWVDDDFNDYTHAARSGEEKFAELISPEIDQILMSEDVH